MDNCQEIIILQFPRMTKRRLIKVIYYKYVKVINHTLIYV